MLTEPNQVQEQRHKTVVINYKKKDGYAKKKENKQLNLANNYIREPKIMYHSLYIVCKTLNQTMESFYKSRAYIYFQKKLIEGLA